MISDTPDCLVSISTSPWCAASSAVSPNGSEIELITKISDTEYTENDLGYWCIEGGKNHIAGNGTNEHGYYNSWDAAHKAFEEYTKDWASVQYEISACACGKFYFWAIK